MMTRAAACLLALGCFLAFAPAPAQTSEEVQIRTTHVAGAVYMLEGRGGNIGVSSGHDGMLIVDDQFASLADKIQAALGEIGEGKVRFVLNTHWHGDHTGGNVVFGPLAPIIAHANVRARLSQQQELRGRIVQPLPPAGLPVITFEQGVSVHFNREEIRVVHYPHGHTDGDGVVFFTGSNVVHMGDLFFAGRFPFVDLGSGGDVEGLLENVGRIVEQLPRDAKVIPGHGPLSSVSDLKIYLATLRETVELVRESMRAGRTLEEMRQQGLPEKYAAWGEGFISTEQWIETVQRSLSGHGGRKRKS